MLSALVLLVLTITNSTSAGSIEKRIEREEEFVEIENTFDIVEMQDTVRVGSSKSPSSDELSDLLIQLEFNPPLKISPLERDTLLNCEGSLENENNKLRSQSKSSFDKEVLLRDALQEANENSQINALLKSIQKELSNKKEQANVISNDLLSENLNEILNQFESSNEIEVEQENETVLQSNNNCNPFDINNDFKLFNHSINNNNSNDVANKLFKVDDEKKILELPNVNQANQYNDEIYSFYGMLLNLITNTDCSFLNVCDQFKHIHSSFKLENSSNLLNILTVPIITSIPTDDYVQIILFCISTYKASFSRIFFDWFNVVRQLTNAPIIIDQVLMKEPKLIVQLIQVEPLELEREFKIEGRKEAFLNFYRKYRLSHCS